MSSSIRCLRRSKSSIETSHSSTTSHYIGLAQNGSPTNYATFRPQKRKINLEIKLNRSEEVTNMIDSAGIDVLPYDTRWNAYRPDLCPPK